MSEILISEKMPVLPLRGLTVFPRQLIHFDVGREKSVKALELAMKGDQRVFLITQKDILDDEPTENGCTELVRSPRSSRFSAFRGIWCGFWWRVSTGRW